MTCKVNDLNPAHRLASAMLEFRQKAFAFNETISVQEQDQALVKGLTNIHRHI